MVVVPGETSAAVLSALIADEAAIGMVNTKTTAVRVIPAIGKKSGDVLDFGRLLGYAPHSGHLLLPAGCVRKSRRTHSRAASGVEELSKILFEQRIFHSMAEEFFHRACRRCAVFPCISFFPSIFALENNRKALYNSPIPCSRKFFWISGVFYLYRANIWCALLFCRLSGGGL